MAPYGMHMNSDENNGNNGISSSNVHTGGNGYNGNGEQDGFRPIPVLLPRT